MVEMLCVDYEPTTNNKLTDYLTFKLVWEIMSATGDELI